MQSSVRDEGSIDKLSITDQPIDKNAIDNPVVIQNQNQQSIDRYFMKQNQHNINSTSQDRQLKSNKNGGKKRKTTIQEPEIKKRLAPPIIANKRPPTENNSDESNPPQPAVRAPEVPDKIRNKKLTEFYKVSGVLKSGETIVNPQAKEVQNGNRFDDQENLVREVDLLRQRIQEKEQSERQLQHQIKRLSWDSAKELEKHALFKREAQEALVPLLLRNEEQRRQLLKIEIEKEKARLGEFVQRRESVRFIEEWEEGYEIKQVKEDIRQKELEKEDLEKQKKEVKTTTNKRERVSLLENSNSQNLLVVNDNVESSGRKQRIFFQLSILMKEETELRNKLKTLDEERNMFIHRLKKYNDEINCRFSKSIQQQTQWPLLSLRYQLLSLLGKGGFSEVYKGFDLEELRMTACKIHHLNPHWTEACKGSYIKHALRENEIHKELNHPNIVKSFDTIEINSESFCTVLEYCEGYDLNYHLKKYKFFTEKEAKIIIKQILDALNYLSSQSVKIIHYDLKPQNILFHKGEVKLSDFGLCKIIDSGNTRMELTSQGLGTYWYLPPECFQTDQPPNISTKVDVWSVGVIMFEMIYGLKPFGQGMSQERIAKEQIILKSTNVTFPPKNGISSECKEFIKKCLTYNMEARWEVHDAFYSNYIQNQK